MNNKYTIKARHPLIRAGLFIETEASERLELIRELNNETQKPL